MRKTVCVKISRMNKYYVAAALFCLFQPCAASGLAQAAKAQAGSCSVRATKGNYALLDPSYAHKGEATILTLENNRISLDIVPEVGGNILKYHDKQSPNFKQDKAHSDWWGNSADAFQRMDDSFGDSGQWKPEPHTYSIDEHGPRRAAVTVTGNGQLLRPAQEEGAAPPPVRMQIKRTVSIDATTTRMQVDVTITNKDTVRVADLRYMVHPLYLQKTLPGPRYYIFMPSPSGVQTFDYERLVKGSYLARTAPARHPFRAWSKKPEDLTKGRYPAGGWLAMSGDSGNQYLSYDPQKFDFVSLWTGSHPAEWMTMEPHSKAFDLQPGQSMKLGFTLALDARDISIKEPAIVTNLVAVPQKLVRGQDFEVVIRAATFLDQPQKSVLKWQCLDAKGKAVVERTLTAQLTPFRFTDILSREKIPLSMRAGFYDWTLIDFASGRKLAGGRFEVLDKAESSRTQLVPKVNPKVNGAAFPPAAWMNSVGMDFVRIPSGEFWMGSDDAEAQDDEKPRHRVQLTRDILMAKHLVTNAQFRRFLPSFAQPTPDYRLQVPLNGDRQPAMPSGTIGDENNVDAYIAWLNANDKSKPAGWKYRLPTEAEWEYAARGPNELKYPWGNLWNSRKANFGDLGLSDGFLSTSAIGAFSPQGDSPFGVSDMAGNVWEWCADYYDEDFYAGSPLRNPVNTKSARAFEWGFDGRVLPKTRVLRGGSWGSSPAFCRTTARFGLFGIPTTDSGFRVVLSPADGSTTR